MLRFIFEPSGELPLVPRQHERLLYPDGFANPDNPSFTRIQLSQTS